MRVVLLTFVTYTLAAQTPATFDSPDAAAKALVEAAKNGRAGFLTLFGEKAADLFPEDETARNAARLVESAGVSLQTVIEPTTRGFATIEVGETHWEFPIPLVKTKSGWRFDANLGRQEVQARRIGTNETAAIEALRAMVDLQMEYTRADRDGDGIQEYAAKIISSPGKQDGLFPATTDSQIVLDFAASMAPAGKAVPFRGYYFKGLAGQGAAAPGGRLSYIVEGNLIGYAMLAWPAEYGISGVRSFLVNADGVVYEKDLGPSTARVAAAMTLFDPGPGWTPVIELDVDEGEGTSN
jgi:hypothetical protein